MQRIQLVATPLYRLEALSRAWGIDLWVKRDDLIPHYMGGNKVRKNWSLLEGLGAGDYRPDALVTNGGANSNHARVVALMGARLGCSVHLVLHGMQSDVPTTCGNAYFYQASGAKVTFVEADEVRSAIGAIVEREEREGKWARIVPGGAHSHEGAEAYANAVHELTFEPDWLLHASGTGGTQAGLLLGVNRLGWSTHVQGISVARKESRGREAIAELLRGEVNAERIAFTDAYRFGGYAQFDRELSSFIEDILIMEGLPLDPVYTGKAMYGLAQMVRDERIPKGARVVFWHTGGLLNLMTCGGTRHQ